MINLNIKIGKDGLTNDEIKQVLCHLKELGMVDIKRLLNGNEFSSMSGENGIKVEFSRKYGTPILHQMWTTSQ